MAQKIMLIDDLDGTDAEETIRYSVDDKDYEIDLSEANVKKFRDALEPFLTKSREVEPEPVVTVMPTRQARRRAASASSGRDDIAEVRAWAESKGITVAPRGRIKQEVYDQYDAEQAKGKSS